MPCFYRVPIYRDQVTESIEHRERPGRDYSYEFRKCGYCLGCRLDRARQWGARCLHEASQHEHNSFLTLTYANTDSVFGSLQLSEIQGFMHRFRKRAWRENRRRFKMFYCGEYGEKRLRPHFHVLIFGHRPEDLVELPRRPGLNAPLYTSNQVSLAWENRGFISVGQVSFESAAYTAGYVMKKQFGKNAPEYYGKLGLTPEFANMSRKGGIGRSWIESFHSEVYPTDEIIIRGKPQKPPKFYDRWFNNFDPAGYAKLQDDRAQKRVESFRLEYDLVGRTMQQKLNDQRALTEARYRTLSRLYESGGSSYA